MAFGSKRDAERVLNVTKKRMEKHHLGLHPEKTKIIMFQSPGKNPKDGPVGTIDFLGFTLYWAKGRKGFWCLKKKTRKEKLQKALKAVSEWCRENRHKKVSWQHKKLSEKLRGHYAYFGTTGNMPWLKKFSFGVARVWQGWLARRSQKRYLSKTRFYKRLNRNPLPQPVIIHRR
jgi:hypothetical protein